MAQQFVMMTLLVLIACGSFCSVNGSHHKHIIIHVPYHIKHHHHTHTIYKHIKHVDHVPDHHIHHHDHHHHDNEYKITSIPSHFDFGDGWASNDYGSISDVGGAPYDGGYDSSSYESNNFGHSGWDDK